MITIRGLSKTYADGTRALNGLDLELGEGMFGLLGPNGAGKTTFLSMLVLALEPSEGELIFDGMDGSRAQDRDRIRAFLGYLPQDFQPIRALTGLEYLEHCGRLRGVALSRRKLRERAMGLLEAVELGKAARRRSGEYSGGMQRRLGMAQALIHRPRILVVDEPTAGLDPEERIRFRNLVSDVAEHTAVLLSTHIVEDVEATCPRLGIIADGELLFDGRPGELLDRVEGRLWRLPAGMEIAEGSVEVAHLTDGEGLAETVMFAVQMPSGSVPRQATLEEAYSTFLALRAGTP